LDTCFSRGVSALAFSMISALTFVLGFIAGAVVWSTLEAAAEYEREQCCKDICECCELGYPVARIDGRWSNTCPDGYQRHCEAYKIRERAFKEQAKDE
jgi:hypothetical protein